jgi:hypothetical protein
MWQGRAWESSAGAVRPAPVDRRRSFAEPAVTRSQAPVGHHVGCCIQRRLYRDLQRVLDEALLAQIPLDRPRPGEGSQLLDAGLHERELLGKKIRIGHRSPQAAPDFR